MHMRFYLSLLFVLACAHSAIAQAPARPEVRGVWITNVASNVLNSRESIAEAMDHLASRGFNVVFPVVWNKGYTLHPSDVMERHFGPSFRQDPFFANQRRDPIAELIFEARRVGMEVIPWFEFGFSSSYGQNGGHIIRAKPHWAALDVNGNLLTKNGFEWMNALHPEVQTFMDDLIFEVIQRYDIDGIQGDDRLPAMPSEGSYDNFTRDLYLSEHPQATRLPVFPRDPAFVRWKANKLTNYLGRLYRRVKAYDPNLIVSMSPSHFDFGYNEYLQDTPRWMDSSYVDILHPQMYRYDIDSYKTLVRMTVGSTPTSTNGYIRPRDKHKVFPGILIRAGSQFNGPAYVLEAVRYNREFGMNGEVYFFYEGLRAANQFLSDSLFTRFYNQPALMPGRNGPRRPPATLVDVTDARLSGSWVVENRVPTFQAPMRKATAASHSTATWSFSPGYTASFDLFAFMPGLTPDGTNAAYYVLKHNRGDSMVVRRSHANISERGMLPLATVEILAGDTLHVILRSAGATDGRQSYAGALMLMVNRKLSPNAVATQSEVQPTPRSPLQGGLRLSAPWPNPATGIAHIGISLEEAGLVSVEVFDVLGRSVAQPLSHQVLHSGSHSVPFQVEHWTPGLYAVVVRSRSSTQSIPLVVTSR